MWKFTANPPLCLKGSHEEYPKGSGETPQERPLEGPRRQSCAHIQKSNLLMPLEAMSCMHRGYGACNLQMEKLSPERGK